MISAVNTPVFFIYIWYVHRRFILDDVRIDRSLRFVYCRVIRLSSWRLRLFGLRRVYGGLASH